MLKTITVAKLRKLLEGEDDAALVAFACDYGDYHHTEQALGLRGELEEALLEESAYSTSGWAVASSDEEDDFCEACQQHKPCSCEEAAEAPKVLIIR